MRQERISAGSYDLNKFLHGGYETDIISTIYGPGGSGKTNFCIIVAVSQARKGNKVVYIDSEGGFSVDRVRQVLAEDEKLESVLNNILILKPVSFEEQEKSFEQLLKHVKSGSVDLIVVDSIAMLYRLELGDAIQSRSDVRIQEVNRKLAWQLKQLNEIARNQKIPVVVTNQVYTEFLSSEELKQGVEKGVSMVGGDLLKYWSKCLIELQNNHGKRRLILKKHRSLPEKTMNFEITNRGIRKRGWI